MGLFITPLSWLMRTWWASLLIRLQNAHDRSGCIVEQMLYQFRFTSLSWWSWRPPWCSSLSSPPPLPGTLPVLLAAEAQGAELTSKLKQIPTPMAPSATPSRSSAERNLCARWHFLLCNFVLSLLLQAVGVYGEATGCPTTWPRLQTPGRR